MPLPPPSTTLFPYTTLFRSPMGGDTPFPGTSCPTLGESYTPVATPPAPSRPSTTPRRRHSRSRANSSKFPERSEEHTSELQSRPHLVCRLLLEKKKQQTIEN